MKFMEKEKNRVEEKKVEKQEDDIQLKIKKERRKERRKKIMSEVKALLLILLIIGSVSFGTWYWYEHVYDTNKANDEKKQEEKETINYNIITYKTENNLYYINDYIIEYEHNIIEKVMDTKANVLYKDSLEFTALYEGVDGYLYAILVEEIETENLITIYRFEDNSFKEIYSLNDSGVFYNPLLYQEKLVGFAGSYETFEKEEEKEYFYILGEEKSKIIKGYKWVEQNKNAKQTENPTDIQVTQYKNNKRYYGLYSLQEDTLKIPCEYESLIQINESTWIAKKDGAVGIINKSGEKLVDFIYDFIEFHEDYYIVCKERKMAIMDQDYNVKTDFLFAYQGIAYIPSSKNDFYSEKRNDKILLTINYDEKTNYLYNYTYVIDGNYNYETIEADRFYYGEILYAYKKSSSTFTIYDENLNSKYTLDFSEYEGKEKANLSLENGTIIAKLDKKYYFDYVTGEELSKPKEPEEIETNLDGITLKRKGNNIKVFYKEEEQFQFNEEDFSIDSIQKRENNYYFPFESTYYAFIRSE